MPLRTVAFLFLLAAPLLLFAVAGGILATQHGWIWPLSIASTLCFLAAGLMRFLPATRRETSPLGRLPEQPQWTDRDRDAASVIAAVRQRTAEDWTGVDLTEPDFYVHTAQTLAADLARIYRPGKRRASPPDDTDTRPGTPGGPLDELSVPEVLAAIRLAIDDLESWTHRSIPRPQAWTVRRLRQAQTAAGYAPSVSAAWYLLGTLRDPTAVLRWGLSQSTSGPLKQAAARELTVTASAFYISTLGGYLIELYAGRLRAGAEAWRDTFGRSQQRLAAAAVDDASRGGTPTITIALVGQTSTGKSSLVNAIVGQTVAAVGAMPLTEGIERYEAALGSTPITLLDTPGYGGDGADAKQADAIRQALDECDIALVVMAASMPARQPEAELFADLQNRFDRDRPLPPLVGVLTQVDRLPPPRDEPPYNRDHPSTPKEHAIAGAVESVDELFGQHLAAVVPVVSEAGRLWNIDAELIPQLIAQLDQARQVALLRGFAQLHAADRWQTVAAKAGRLVGDVASVWLRNQLTKPLTKPTKT